MAETNALSLLDELSAFDDASSNLSAAKQEEPVSRPDSRGATEKKRQSSFRMSSAINREGSVKHGSIKNGGESIEGASSVGDVSIALRSEGVVSFQSYQSSARSLETGQASEVVWVDEEMVDNCLVCDAAFGMFNRKHHCRECGHVVCASCSQSRLPVQGLPSVQRICDECVAKRAEEETGDGMESSGGEEMNDDMARGEEMNDDSVEVSMPSGPEFNDEDVVAMPTMSYPGSSMLGDLLAGNDRENETENEATANENLSKRNSALGIVTKIAAEDPNIKEELQQVAEDETLGDELENQAVQEQQAAIGNENGNEVLLTSEDSVRSNNRNANEACIKGCCVIS